MNQHILFYNLKQKKVELLSDRDKKTYIANIQDDIERYVVNYIEYKLSEQETFLFEYSEEKILKDKKLFYELVQRLIDEIKKGGKYLYIISKEIKFIQTEEKEEKIEMDLDYDEICGIVNLIIYIFENLNKKKREESLYRFAFKGIIPDNIVDFKGVKVLKIVTKLSLVKKII